MLVYLASSNPRERHSRGKGEGKKRWRSNEERGHVDDGGVMRKREREVERERGVERRGKSEMSPRQSSLTF